MTGAVPGVAATAASTVELRRFLRIAIGCVVAVDLAGEAAFRWRLATRRVSGVVDASVHQAHHELHQVVLLRLVHRLLATR